MFSELNGHVWHDICLFGGKQTLNPNSRVGSKTNTNMKNLMMGMALAVFVAGAANAQDAPRKTMDERAMMTTERMVKELGLDEKQAEKVKSINARYAEKMEAMQAGRQDEVRGRNEKRDALRKEHMEELKEVLTEEQFKKLEERQEEMREKRMENRENRPMQKREGLNRAPAQQGKAQ